MKHTLVLLLLLLLTGCKPKPVVAPTLHIKPASSMAVQLTSTGEGTLPSTISGNYIESAANTTSMPMTKDSSPSCHCDPNALDYAVIDRLRESGVPDYDDESSGLSKSELDREHAQLEKLYDWADKLTDTCLQSTYVRFLRTYDRDLEKAYQALRNRQSGVKPTEDSSQAKVRRDLIEAEHCKRDGTVPRIPQSVFHVKAELP